MVHVAGKKNAVADGLSRKPQPEGWEPPNRPEEDIDAFIDAEIGHTRLQMEPLISLQYAAGRINA
jgi:hypothetical protein